MDTFDDIIKKKAKSEKVYAPSGFSERINEITENLVKNKSIKRSKRSFAVLIAAVMLLIMTTVISFAAPLAANMAGGTISYFNAPKEFRYLSKMAEYQKYNAEVGITCEDGGISITLENIAVDDNYINVFYTLRSENPIELCGDEESPLKWRLQWTAVNFWFKADGKFIEPAAEIEKDAYLTDEYTMKGMQRFAIMDELHNNFNVELYTDYILNKEGQWHIAVNVDKTNVAVDSATVMPNKSAKVTSGWGNRTKKHNITVKKVSISPFGNLVILSERGSNTFSEFALRDDKGNYLTVIPAAIHNNPILKVDNSFEFIAQNKDINSITIIPIMSDGHSEEKNVLINQLPAEVPINDYGSYTINSVNIDEEKFQVTVYQNGAVPVMNFSLTPTDENGKLIEYENFASIDYEYDRESGAIIVTGYWSKDVNIKELKKIKGFNYWANYDFKLNEDESITVDLK